MPAARMVVVAAIAVEGITGLLARGTAWAATPWKSRANALLIAETYPGLKKDLR